MLLAFQHLAVAESELSLRRVLRCGQAFRWVEREGVWSCTLGNHAVFLRQRASGIDYAMAPPHPDGEGLLRDYFQLDVDLTSLYKQWSLADLRFKGGCVGIRILRQDPWETLCLFICLLNNNVKRISNMCRAMCEEWGEEVAEVDGVKYWGFPSPEKLAVEGVEQRLRELGFGYRARYLYETAVMVQEQGRDQLMELRGKEYGEVKARLVEYTGVGPKVADCVALMLMDQNAVVPVDTHVLQIAKRDYGRKVGSGEKGNAAVAAFFGELWGEYAGWAHSVLFAVDIGVEEVVKQEAEEVVKQEAEEAVKQEAEEAVKREILENDLKIPAPNTLPPKRARKK